MTEATRSRFSRGGDEAEEMSKSTGGGGGRRRAEFLKLNEGESVVLRYLLDQRQWYNTLQHTGVPTKAKPSDWPAGSNWPQSMPAICRYDKAFAAYPEENLPAIHTDCYICDAKVVDSYGKIAKPKPRHWTLAVVREEVIGTQAMADAEQITPGQVGQRVGFKDRLREVEVPKKDDKGEFVKSPDGSLVMETVKERDIVVINQPMKNYFGGLNSLFSVYKTLCDRDYHVTRYNSGQDTDYRHVPLDRTEDLMPGTEKWKRYETAIEEMGDAASIEAMITERSSDEYYALFFDPNKQAPSRGNGSGNNSQQPAAEAPVQGGAPVAQQETKQAKEPSEDAVAQMRNRLKSGATPAAALGIPEPDAAPSLAKSAPADFDS